MIIRFPLHVIAVVLLALATLPAASQNIDKTDRLGVPGPVAFEGRNYALAWTSNPRPDYFKQEYLPEGQGSENYTHMFLIETLISGATAKDAAASQIAMLNERKAKDPLVNHEVSVNKKTGEIILDFLISGAAQDGKVVVEWNAYRYVTMKGDKPGVVLYGISRRAYGETEGRAFLTGLKDQRPDTIKALVDLDVPAVTPRP